MLLRAGASPDLPDRRSDGRLYTPLFHAATHPNLRNEDLSQAILEAGATIGLGASPLEARDKMEPEVLKMITGAFNHQTLPFQLLSILNSGCLDSVWLLMLLIN